MSSSGIPLFEQKNEKSVELDLRHLYSTRAPEEFPKTRVSQGTALGWLNNSGIQDAVFWNVVIYIQNRWVILCGRWGVSGAYGITRFSLNSFARALADSKRDLGGCNHSLLLFTEMKLFSAFWIHFTERFPQQVRYRFVAKWKAFSRKKPPALPGAANLTFWIISLCLTGLGSAGGCQWHPELTSSQPHQSFIPHIQPAPLLGRGPRGGWVTLSCWCHQVGSS